MDTAGAEILCSQMKQKKKRRLAHSRMNHVTYCPAVTISQSSTKERRVLCVCVRAHQGVARVSSRLADR